MLNTLYLKHLLVRSPAEVAAKRMQRLLWLPKLLLHPGLREVYLEEGRMERVVRRLVRPDSNCIDVGAHIGSTLSLLLKLAPRGRHLAFEPLPQKAAWLRKKFPEVEIHAAALGTNSGEVSFVENLTRSGFSGLRARPGPAEVTREITVRCERLDDVLGGRRVDFLKADVEGAELMVFHGAEGVLRRDRPALVFESGPGGAERFGYGLMDLYNYLKGIGYYIYLFKDFLAGGPPLSPADFDAAHVYPFAAFKYVAVPSQ